MKSIVTLMFAIALVTSPLGFADEASSAEAEILLSKINMKTAMENSMNSLIDLQIQQQPALGPYRGVMKSFFDKYMSFDSLKPELVKIYANAFTAQELKDINAFYDTDTGKKALEMMPTLMGQGGQLGANRVQANMEELRRMIEEESARLRAQQEAAAGQAQ